MVRLMEGSGHPMVCLCFSSIFTLKRPFDALVIPDYAKLSWRIRARTLKQLKGIRERIVKCFEYIILLIFLIAF